MHYYQHHIGDFMRDAANLNDHQLATYLRMLWVYYDTEAPIRGDFEDVAFAMRSDEKTVRLLLRHYFKETEEGWRHTRCDREIEEYHAKADKARKSANARWKNADALRTDCDGNASETVSGANQEPRTKNQEEKKRGEAPRKRSTSTTTIDRPEDVDPQTWTDWVAHRKAKRATVTETVLKGARSEAAKAGMPLDAFLQVWCRRGYQGLEAEWLRPEERRTASRVRPMSFAQQDEQARHQRWEDMTGRQWHADGAGPDVIDIEATTKNTTTTRIEHEPADESN